MFRKMHQADQRSEGVDIHSRPLRSSFCGGIDGKAAGHGFIVVPVAALEIP